MATEYLENFRYFMKISSLKTFLLTIKVSKLAILGFLLGLENNKILQEEEPKDIFLQKSI
jgi:hypothetical protein